VELPAIRPLITLDEDLLADLEDRAAQLNLQNSDGGHTQRVVALVAVLTEHHPIQDVDMACS
jgi:hypothetical protein